MKRKLLTLVFVLALFLVAFSVATVATEDGATPTDIDALISSFEGKKVSIIGDSISTMEGVSNSTAYNTTIGSNAVYYSSGQADKWWQQVIDTLGMELCVNNSWSGSMVLNNNKGTETNNSAGYVTRCVNLHNDRGETPILPDIIWVFLGTNDFTHNKSNWGTASAIDYDTLIVYSEADGNYSYATPTTVLEAYAIMLHKMQIAYPEADIYCADLLPRRNPVLEGKTDVGQPTEANAEMRTVASEMGAKLIDFENCGLSSEPELFDIYITDQHLHPGNMGMDLMSVAVMNAMLGTDYYKNIGFHSDAASISNGAFYVTKGSSYETNVTLDTYYENLSVTVTMDGVDITSSVYADGKVSIPSVDGDVFITAQGTKAAGLTGEEPGKYSWVYDPDTYTLTISPIGTNKTLVAYDESKSSSNAFAQWRLEYNDFRKQVQHLVLDDQFTKLQYQHGQSVFANWPSVQTIYLGGVTEIVNTWAGSGSNYGTTGGGAFANNTNLTTVWGKGQEKAVGVVNLSSLYFSKSIEEASNIFNTRYMLYGCEKVTTVILPTSIDKYINTHMFYNCYALSVIEIPSWVTSVNGNAFYNCRALTSITFPENVETIAATALTGCTGLSEITFANPELTIPDGMVIPDNENLVINCSSVAQATALSAIVDIQKVTIKLQASGNLLSDGTGFDYQIIDGVLTIDKAEATSGTVLSTDIAIDFGSVVNVIIITENTGITEISADFFKGFAAHTVAVPSTLKAIGAGAFANMPNLTTLVDYTAYTADSTAGKGIINLLGITTLAEDAFSGSSSALTVSVYIGKDTTTATEVVASLNFFAEDAVVSYFVYPTNDFTTYMRNNNVAFSYLTAEQTGDDLLLLEGSCKNASGTVVFKWRFDTATGKLTVFPPAGETASNSTSFAFLENYTGWPTWKAVWKDAIESFFVMNFGGYRIEYRKQESPFSNLPNLKHIHLDKTTYRLRRMTNGNGMFAGCSSLTTISSGADATYDEIIDLSGWRKQDLAMNDMFSGCSSIKNVILSSDLTPNETSQPAVSVASNYFKNCTSLTKIEITASYLSIAANAFTGCINLSEVVLRSANTAINAATAFPDVEGLIIVCASQAQVDTINSFGYTYTKATLSVGGNLLAAGNGFAYMLRENSDVVGDASGYTLLISKVTATEGTALSSDNIPSEYLAKITEVIADDGTGITEVSEGFFAQFTALRSVAIPGTLASLGANSFADLADLDTVALYSDYYSADFDGEGIIDLRNVTVLAPDAFSGAFKNTTPVIYIAKTAEIDGELSLGSADSTSITVYTYPSGSAAAALRALDADNIDHQYYTVEMMGDEWLVREMSLSNFAWTFDTETGTLNITETNSNNFDVGQNQTTWPAWKAVWKDAIEYFFVDNSFTGYIWYQKNNSAFSNLPNLKHVHMGGIHTIRRSSQETNGLFSGCTSLTTVSYGSDNTYDEVIDLSWWNKNGYAQSNMFYNCYSIKSVIMPRNLDKYNADASSIAVFSNMFANCRSLQTLFIPDCFASIGAGSFSGCDKLSKIVIEKADIGLSSATAATFPQNAVVHCFEENTVAALQELGANVIDLHAITADGFKIRYKDYNGLRGMFTFDKAQGRKLAANGYELKEWGVIMAPANEYNYWGVDMKLVHGEYTTYGTAIKKIPVVQGGDIVGNILHNTTTDIEFAGSVVKYAENHTRDLYIGAYIICIDEDGNELISHINHKDSAGNEVFNLYDITLGMYKNADITEILTAELDEKSVWNTLLQGADTSVRETTVGANEGITVTLIKESSDSASYIPFIRSERGVTVTDAIIEEAMALIPVEIALSETSAIVVNIADMGSVAPDFYESIIYTPTISTKKYPRYATPDPDQIYGAQHPQGMTIDDEGNIYISFTGLIVKVNQMGETMGVYKVASKWTSGLSMHVGNIYWHKGKIYIGLGLSNTAVSGGKRYIGVLDDSVFTDYNGYVQDTDENALMKAVCIEEISYDKNYTTEGGTTFAKFGGGGIDGITVGKLPGKGYILPAGYVVKEDITASNGKVYTAGTVLSEEVEVTDTEDYIVAVRTQGSYDEYRYDDDNKQVMVFDFDDIVDGENLLPMSYDRVAADYDGATVGIKYNMFVYNGYHEYGTQVICHDKATGDYQLWTYERASKNNEFPDGSFYVIDGSKKLRLEEIEVGQSVPADSDMYSMASEWASCYTDEKDLDNDGDTSERLIGWVATLKCVCGKEDIEDHEAVVYGETGYAAKICGLHTTLQGDNGCISLGNDFFYITSQTSETVYKADGTTTQTAYGCQARLYALSRKTGKWTFTRVTSW